MIYLNKKNYPYLEEVNSAVLKQIPFCDVAQDKKILDIGCGQASLALEMKKKGYHVWGIEQNEFAANVAQARIDCVINKNLTAFDEIVAQLNPAQFDYIVFSDILEHLYDPLTTLNFYLKFLKPEGQVIISVPNAVVWLNRLQFLWGQFEYTDTGVMDRTHIRFFTFKTAKQLVRATTCRVIRTDLSPFLVRALLPLIKKIMLKKSENNPKDSREIIDSLFYRLYMRFVYPVEYAICYCWRTFFAFQIIVVAEKPNKM